MIVVALFLPLHPNGPKLMYIYYSALLFCPCVTQRHTPVKLAIAIDIAVTLTRLLVYATC